MKKYLNTLFLGIITILLSIIASKSFQAPEKQAMEYEYTVTELYPTGIEGGEVLQHPFHKKLNQGWEPVTTFSLSNNTTWCIMRRSKPTP